MIDYEKKYKNLISSFRETLCDIYDNEEDMQYFRKASDEIIIDCINDLVFEAIKQPSQHMLALQFEVMRKAFSK